MLTTLNTYEGFLDKTIISYGVICVTFIKFLLKLLIVTNITLFGRSGSVVKCLTRDQKAAGSSLKGVTALWSLSKTHLS